MAATWKSERGRATADAGRAPFDLIHTSPAGRERAPTEALARRYTQFLLDYAISRGVDPHAAFGDEPVVAIHGRHGSWNNHHMALISRHLKMIMQDDFYGMLAPGRMPRDAIRFACEIGTLSETLQEALERAFYFMALAGEGVRFTLSVEAGAAAIRMSVSCASPAIEEFLAEWQLWFWRHLAQWFVATEIPLLAVDLPHEPLGAPEDYEAPFGLRGRFGQGEARIVFPASALALRVLRTPADLVDLYSHTSVPLSYSPELPSSPSSLVKSALRSQLRVAGSMPTLDELAGAYGVCAQTLRRRLRAEGVSFRELKADVRRDIARQCISGGAASLSDVAAQVGYAEANSLARAIRGWTGQSAAEFRRNLGAG